MTALKDRIVRRIEMEGPISVSDYMALCLFDPEHGYYTTRQPFGANGDFTTAPEISQMFGELLAVWIYSAWQQTGSSMPAIFAEIGPGRGTMMADMLRTLNQIDPQFCASAEIVMIEASPRLAGRQKHALGRAPARLDWIASIDGLRPLPLFIVGNELFDAIPFRQYVKTAGGWRERCIGVTSQGALAFALGPSSPDRRLLPSGSDSASDGSIVEIAPQRFALMETICRHIGAHGGAGLFIDYGYFGPAFGDTFQALRAHQHADLLSDPGTADLTSHVDFAALAAAAKVASLSAACGTQGDFLVKMGLLERAASLGASVDERARTQIRAAVDRLAGEKAMGKLFKVIAVAGQTLPLPPFP
jgi:SAM-dependent MidA family methyltransferase